MSAEDVPMIALDVNDLWRIDSFIGEHYDNLVEILRRPERLGANERRSYRKWVQEYHPTVEKIREARRRLGDPPDADGGT